MLSNLYLQIHQNLKQPETHLKRSKYINLESLQDTGRDLPTSPAALAARGPASLEASQKELLGPGLRLESLEYRFCGIAARVCNLGLKILRFKRRHSEFRALDLARFRVRIGFGGLGFGELLE